MTIRANLYQTRLDHGSAAIRCAVTAVLGLSLAVGAGDEARAQEASFETIHAKTFAMCLPKMNSLADRLRTEPEAEKIFDSTEESPIKDGKLQVYSGPLTQLREIAPQAYSQVEDEAKGCGFESAVTFGDLGDKVMAAYLARKIPPGTAQQIAQLSPDMIQLMPPGAKQGFAMIKALDSVSEADKANLTDEVMGLIDLASEDASSLARIPDVNP